MSQPPTDHDPEARLRTILSLHQRALVQAAREDMAHGDLEAERATLQRQVDRQAGELDGLRQFLIAQFEGVKVAINGRIREQDLKIALAEARIDGKIQSNEQLNRIVRRLVFGASAIFLAAFISALAAIVIVSRAPGEPVNLRGSAMERSR
jgi:hypothetical protein